jgi:PAS domain S-box-containing protein
VGSAPHDNPGVSDSETSDGPRTSELALLEAAERIAQIGSFEWLPDVPELRWTDNLFRIFGLEPGEIAPNRDFWLDRVHPDDRERVDFSIQHFDETGQITSTLEYRFLRPDGALRHFRSTTAVVEGEDGRRRIIGPIQDVTDQRRAEREIAAHVAASQVLANWESLEQGAIGLLASLAAAMDFETGVLWLPEDRVLSPRFVWQSRRMDGSEFESVTRQLRFPRGAGLPGRVWEAQLPLSWARAGQEQSFERRGAADLSGAVAFPAINDSETVAVLEFYSREDAALTDRSLRSLAGIGSELGGFLARRKGELGPVRSLTPRELEVLQLATNGLSGREIAAQLVVSPSTIKTHFNHIYEKLGVADRAAAVATALRLGLIE